MALRQKRTPEQKAQESTAKAEKRAEDDRVKQELKRLDEIESMRKAFFATPPGQARQAYDDRDPVFQYSIDVMHQQAIIVPMVGSTTSKQTADPSAILNAVCHEGWELVNGSFVFIEQGQQSRDKFLASGQNVAIKGTVVGYYVFKRCEANKEETEMPWETEPTVFSGSADEELENE
jgi:hypothetical protein